MLLLIRWRNHNLKWQNNGYIFDSNICYYLLMSLDFEVEVEDTSLRPDLINLLFLRSFPGLFHRVERDNNKNKRKNIQTIAWKCYIFRKIVFFKKIISCFPDFSWLFSMINVPEDPRNNKTIEPGLMARWGVYCRLVCYLLYSKHGHLADTAK